MGKDLKGEKQYKGGNETKNESIFQKSRSRERVGVRRLRKWGGAKPLGDCNRVIRESTKRNVWSGSRESMGIEKRRRGDQQTEPRRKVCRERVTQKKRTEGKR